MSEKTRSGPDLGDAADELGGETSAPTRQLPAWMIWGWRLLFVAIALAPVWARIKRPTLLGDDVIRVIDLIEHPLRDLLFRPFSEHVAPLFELISWTTWQAIGHDLRLSPLGFSVASVLGWILCLILLGIWLHRETRSRTATLVALALAAQSPLALEAMWWYSASSFTYAVAGLLLALLGASLTSTRPGRGALLIVAGTALGPAASSIGVLGTPLAACRAMIDPDASWRRKALAVAASALGLAAYLLAGAFGGMSLLRSAKQNNAGMAEPITGLAYALKVPGHLLWPSLAGLRPSWLLQAVTPGLRWAAGLAALSAMLFLLAKPRASWNRRLVLLGVAMIYLAYAMTYGSRAGLVRQGRWTEAGLLYQVGGRYHLLPLLGASAIIAAILAALPAVRRFDRSRFKPLATGVFVGLVALLANRPGQDDWRWMLVQPEQMPTLTALHHVGQIAQQEGISREQLRRAFDPVCRPWNSCLRVFENKFHFMSLVVQAPFSVPHQFSDVEARARVMAALSEPERLALHAGAVYTRGTSPTPTDLESLATARLVSVQNVKELEDGHFQSTGWPAYLEYEIDSPQGARYLGLPGLSSDKDLKIQWRDESGRWSRLQYVCWIPTTSKTTATAVDLDRIVNWPAGRSTRIRVEFTEPAVMTLGQPPRLLR